MAENFTNFGETTLSSAITNVATSIPVVNGANFPTSNFSIVIGDTVSGREVVLCSSRSGNTITASARGQQGTSAIAHASGKAVVHGVLAHHVNPLAHAKGYRNAAWTNPGAINTFVTVPFDTEVYDSGTIFDPANGNFTVPSAGIYVAQSRISIGTAANSERFILSVFVNGSEGDRGSDSFALTGDLLSVDLTVYSEISLAANDVVTFRLRQLSGTLRAIEVGASFAYATVRQVIK